METCEYCGEQSMALPLDVYDFDEYDRNLDPIQFCSWEHLRDYAIDYVISRARNG